MKKRKRVIHSIHTTLLVIMFLTAAGIAQVIDKGRDKKMGYCFDAAFDTARNRLYVVGGSAGMHVFSVTRGEFHFVTTVYDEGYYRNIKISGDRAFVADAGRGLTVFDISKDIPTLTWKWKEVNSNTAGMGIHVEGHFAYLALGSQNDPSGLSIFDISNPDSPCLIGHCETPNAWDVWVSGRFAYVADLNGGLVIIDVSTPSSPRKVSEVTWDSSPSGEIIRGEGHVAYVAAGHEGLVSIDISNPSNPKVLAQFKSGPRGFGEGLCVQDGIVYLANGNDEVSEENGLLVIDGRNPKHLKVIGRCTFRGWVEGVCLADKYLFVTNTGYGVRSINVSDPQRPHLVDSYGPMKTTPSIAEPLLKLIRTEGIVLAVAKYRRLQTDSADAYDFGEEELNRLGYILLREKNNDAAIEVFKLNVEAYPQSSNVYDSLGEGYMIRGDKDLATKNYQKSLDLNPKNTNAAQMLAKLKH